MGEGDLVEQYQGIIIATSLYRPTADGVFYAPSQRKEFEEYARMGHLPDGRRIAQSEWLDNPVDRKGLEIVLLNLTLERFSALGGVPEEPIDG